MGYMALLRNIGNFLSSDISIESCNFVASKLSNKKSVMESKQLPFRFISAYRTLYPSKINSYGAGIDRNRDSWNKKKTQIFLEAIEIALNHSAENIPLFPGSTCVVADNSGSMDAPISSKSVMSIKDVANVLCAILHRRSSDSLVGAFGENVVWPPITKGNSILTNMDKIANYNSSFRGHATNAWKIFEHLIENKIKVDRIVIISDLQCYTLSSYQFSFNRVAPIISVAEKVKEYQRDINPEAFVHFFDLQGYGVKLAPPSPLINTVAGFSEKIFNQILVFENARIVEGPELPSLQYIRTNY